MTENKRVAFAKENKFLGYWRKRYWLQILGILLGMAYIVWCICYYVTFILAQILLILLVFVLMYYFIKAYNEEIQARAEVLILGYSDEFLQGLELDYGKGLGIKDLDAQGIVEDYNARECYNVVKGEGFVIEEDWFYSAGKADFHITNFRGIVIAVDNELLIEGARGRMVNRKGVIEFEEKIDFDTKRGNLEKKLQEIMVLFGAKTMDMVVFNHRLYLWVSTKSKLFYQFRLWGNSSMVLFVQRIKRIEGLVKNIAENIRN